MSIEELKFVEDYARTLSYEQGISDYNRSLILANLKAFYSYLKDQNKLK